jgi:hypothetical protein|tara:strand:+ start:1080 stop:1661 length:582 start_codon:yes stop_codon:yes gene_type:complete
MAWGKIGSDTLQTSGTTIEVLNPTEGFIQGISTTISSSGSITPYMRLNLNSGNSAVYSFRYDKGTSYPDAIATSQSAGIYFQNGNGGNYSTPQFNIFTIFNIDSEETLMFANTVNQMTAGATVPVRTVIAAKMTTSLSFDRVRYFNNSSGSFGSGSNMVLLGDIITKVVDGAIFYETDTNKSYVLYNGSWTEL